MDIGGPRQPPSGAHGLLVPELLQTNRQILEQMRDLNRAHEATRAGALAAEDRHTASMAAAAQQSREAHEATMHMFRSALNPHAEAIAAMHAGAASLHGAAQDIRSSAAQHRQMAAESSDLFVTAMRQGLEAMRPPTASQRPDEVLAAGPETSFNPPLNPTIVAVDEGMASAAKRAKSQPLEEVHERAAKTMRAAAASASRGASRAAAASDAPAVLEDQVRAPGFHPEAQETEAAARPHGVTIQAPRGRSRSAHKVRQIALDELQPHDESGAVITGEPNSTIRVQSVPKQRIRSVDVQPPRTRSRSVKTTPAGKAKAARSPSVVRQVVV